MFSKIGPVVKKKIAEKMHFKWIYSDDFEKTGV
jgi:hypothetical protein